MSDQHRKRIDQLLQLFDQDEDRFNRSTEAQQLGVYLHRGRIYPAAIGTSHTARLAHQLLYAPPHEQPGGNLLYSCEAGPLKAISPSR